MAQDPVADRLRRAPIAPQVRAQVWDLFQSARDESDLADQLRGISIPNEVKADLWDMKLSAAAAPDPSGGAEQPPQEPAAPQHPIGRLGNAIKDVAIGFGKGAADTAVNLGSAVHKIPGVTGAVDALYGQEGLSDAAFPAASEALAATNTAQKVGKVAEFAAEMAIPVGQAVKVARKVIPTTAKAGAKFQSVKAAAGDVALDVSEPGEVALRIYQLSERGGSMPKAVRDFLKRTTDPEKGPLTYSEARDFASNISRLSVNEFGRLTPAIAREIHRLRVALNKAVGQAAEKAGKGDDYAAAMKEYARAMRMRDAWEATKRWAVPAGAATAAGAYAAKVLRGGGD